MSKKKRLQDNFFEELKKIPIVLVACEKSGISRNSIYRWKREDKKFSEMMDEALFEGEALVNDMSESQLLTLIKEKNWPAISFWLRHRNPKFRDKIEVTSKTEDTGELSPFQTKVVRQALKLAKILPESRQKINKLKIKKYEAKQNDSAKVSTADDQGQTSKDGNN